MSDSYRVQLEMFEGPLDLLMFLIRRAEVDIAEIPIATIADQYIAQLEGIERIDIELAGEFLVMAATLMEIKSRMIGPKEDGTETDAGPEREAGPAEDPRAELVRQLLEYKQYRDTAEALNQRRLEWAHRFPGTAGIDDERVREAMDDLGEIELDDVSVVDLVEAFSGIITAVNFDRMGDHQVVADDTPLELHAEDLLDRIRRDGRIRLDGGESEIGLRDVFVGRTRGEMIGLFLAMLELVKYQRVGFRQDQETTEIFVHARDEAAPELGALADGTSDSTT